MSDKEKSLDLDTAQRLYIAAGHPEQAEAAGFVLDAVRNMVQGEWGKSFVASLEGLLKKYIDPLTEAQKETQDGVAALGGRFQASVDELATRLDHKRERLDAHDVRLDALERNNARFEALEAAVQRLVAAVQRLEARDNG